MKYFHWIGIFLVLWLSTGCHRSPGPERVLWYRQPARYFEEALPLGNGRIGITVYGGVKSEHILHQPRLRTCIKHLTVMSAPQLLA